MQHMPRPEYPRELEAWWLRCAREQLGVTNDTAALRTLDAAVAKLSDGFTTERVAGFDDYATDGRALLAYGLFFFPQTFVRTLFQFDEVRARCGWNPPAQGALRVVDLGAGTGAAGLALASRLSRERDVRLVAVERSASSLALASRLAQENARLWPRLTFDGLPGDLVHGVEKADGADVIVASFATNEAFHERPEAEFDAWADRVLTALAPGGLLLLSEPAMPATSARLGRLRDRICASGKMSVLAPCLHQRPCPMLAGGGDAFCHEVRGWKPTRSIQSLNSRLFRSIEVLKFCFVAIANRAPAAAAPGADARLVSPLLQLKGRFQCDGCAADGVLRRYEILTRSLDTGARHALRQIERGDVVGWRELRVLGDGATHRAERAEIQACFGRREAAPGRAD